MSEEITIHTPRILTDPWPNKTKLIRKEFVGVEDGSLLKDEVIGDRHISPHSVHGSKIIDGTLEAVELADSAKMARKVFVQGTCPILENNQSCIWENNPGDMKVYLVVRINDQYYKTIMTLHQG